MKPIFLMFILLFCLSKKSSSQDIEFAREVVDTLSSSFFWGRGYTENGMSKASAYLANEFKKIGLKALDNNYTQDFYYPVNTFPGAMELKINGQKLIPGRDFIVNAESQGTKSTVKLAKKDSAHYVNAEHRIIISLEDKLTWSPSQRKENYTSIQLDKKVASLPLKKIAANIESKFINDFKASNVIGFLPGTAKPDSFIVFSGHYDHLGGMGRTTYFPGANDNASGIALLLGLARYFSAHPQKYSILFICFAGEEAGLLGSKYYTENPVFPLGQIKFLVNTDMVGTGEEGITVVNATVHPTEFDILKEINDASHYLVKINSRGKAANSDHYWFTEKGVPAFFIYTLGGIKAYHDIFDQSATLPLTAYDNLFNLLLKFTERLQN